MPFLGGVEKTSSNSLSGTAVFCSDIGYVQYVDMKVLQALAKEHDLRIMVDAMPGSFLAPGRPVVTLSSPKPVDDNLRAKIAEAFVIGANRTFDADPRFGLIVLSEIAARALSPAVNDPGTAIVIIGSFVRLFANWLAPLAEGEKVEEKYDRVIVPALSLAEMFDDAFTAIARDGAGTVEVGIRLQKAFVSLSSVDDPQMRAQARRHSEIALERAGKALTLDGDLSRLQEISKVIR
jgi:uncharacterized membrane protein